MKGENIPHWHAKFTPAKARAVKYFSQVERIAC